jgi:hypothetical protein
MKYFSTLLSLVLALAVFLFAQQSAWAFCGFYVAKADSKLYNKASQVVMARNGDRTVLTMANDYQGDVKDFALVIPVPVILQQEQVNVGNAKIIERLDAFSAPRLVEYFDPDPCQIYDGRDAMPSNAALESLSATRRGEMKKNSLGVTIENQFTAGEYDILILSAKDSDGLEKWLTINGYKIPSGASQLLRPYIRQKMKFFVAKVNLNEYANTGFQSLRPLMMAYESPKFMLPIRLGMINGQGEQDLIVYLLSPKGQTEITNYRSLKVPSDVELPEFIPNKFNNFYTSMFTKSYQQEGKKVAFIEYAWNMANCDPCSADPLNQQELKEAGVFWLNSPQNNVFITRLHVRYDRQHFPEDLRFQETANGQLFQGRYIIRHPYQGEMKCDAARQYKQQVRNRQEKEVQTLANLTGWNINELRKKVNFIEVKPTPWWHQLWN